MAHDNLVSVTSQVKEFMKMHNKGGLLNGSKTQVNGYIVGIHYTLNPVFNSQRMWAFYFCVITSCHTCMSL